MTKSELLALAERVEITQADQDAANEWVRGMPLGLKLTLSSPHKLYEAFARHRIESEAALRPKIATWLRQPGSADLCDIADMIERGEAG